jgi:hypothetical protein
MVRLSVRRYNKVIIVANQIIPNTPKHNSKVTGWLQKLTRVRFASLKKSPPSVPPGSIFWSALAPFAPNLWAQGHYVLLYFSL